MELTGIKSLYSEMKQTDENRQQFRFTYNSKDARVLFLIDRCPFLLCFCAIGNPQYFQIELQQGFRVETFLNTDTLERLKDMFGIGIVKKGEFRTSDFFACFNRHIPQHLKDTDMVRPKDLPLSLKRDVEESDKVYFWRFRINSDGAHVSDSNLEKTQRFIGEDAYQMCRTNNISTQWTDISQDDNFDGWKQMLKLKIAEGK